MAMNRGCIHLLLLASIPTLARGQRTADQITADKVPLARIAEMTYSEKARLAESIVERGVPSPDSADTLYALVAVDGSFILPRIEAKIACVLIASNADACFSQKGLSASVAVIKLQSVMWQTGSLEALRQTSKLLKIEFDRSRFHATVASNLDSMVADILDAAYGKNRFKLAYQALEIGDPAINTRLFAWIDQLLSRELPNSGNPIFETRNASYVGEWAEALVDRYGGIPSDTQLFEDPIASRLRPELNALHNQVRRFTGEIVEERARKKAQ